MKVKIRYLFILCLSWCLFCWNTPSYGVDNDQTNTVNKITNAGFELDKNGGKNQNVPEWTTISEKDSDAGFTEAGWTHSGKNKLTHWKGEDFKVCTSQTVTKLASGSYHFEFWYANGDGAQNCYVELKDFGGDPIKIPVTKSGSWIKKEVNDVKITSGKCTISVYSDAKGGYWINLDDFMLCSRQDAASIEAAVTITAPETKNMLTNAGFEEGDEAEFTGWQVESTKDKDAVKRESGWTHSGQYKLVNWKDQDYQVYTYQTVKELKKDTYTLEFMYANGGKQKDCYVEIKDFGGPAIKETLPTSPQWTRVRIPDIKVTKGQCTIGINTDAEAKYWINLDDFALSPGEKYPEPDQINFTAEESPLAIKGVDISTLPQVEAGGGKFYNQAGDQEDLLQILKENGVNYIRLRIWNDPKNGVCGLANTLTMAKRVKQAGMGLLLDFHYSDTWADPGKQEKPAAWKDLDFEGLNQAVYQYSKDVITALKKQNTLPDMVQIGNEIRSGMLFPDGQLTNMSSFNNLAKLINSGVEGVNAALAPGDKVKIMIHLDKGGDSQAYTYFFDNLIAYGAGFDIIGLSYYSAWHGSQTDLYNNLCNLVKQYKKDLVVVETSYPFCMNNADGLENMIAREDQIKQTGYPPTIAGQKQYLTDLINLIKHTPGGHGLGFFYWEGAWLPVKGAGWDPADPKSENACENQCLFNYNGYALDSLRAFQLK